MDAINAWLEDGAKNAENFFIDEDGDFPAVSGCATIVVGGMFAFYLRTSAPFTIQLDANNTSPALKKFVQHCAGDHADPGKALSVATESYLKICDALDAENADEEDDVTQADEEDALDRASREALTAAEAEKRRRQVEMDAEFERIKTQFDVTRLPKPAIERILSDYNAVRQSNHHGWRAGPRGRNLALWDLELFNFDKGSQLEKDMQQVAARTGKASIEMTIEFPNEYPFRPPFIRVLRPRFAFRTGRVTVGGSICTQLLTDEGWKPIYDIESVIETVREQITCVDSKAAIDHSNTADYTEAEAREAFQRVAEHHRRNGW